MQRIPDLTFTRSSETEETLAHGRADRDATGMKKNQRADDMADLHREETTSPTFICHFHLKLT